MEKHILLIGGGGHCKACIDVIERTGSFRITGIVDHSDRLGQRVLGYPIIGSDNDLSDLIRTYESFLIAIGQIKSAEPRIRLFETLKSLGAEPAVIVSPTAYVSPHARLGEGTIVMHQAFVGPDAVVGRNCIVNNKAHLEHDANVGDHCHIATNAIVNGGVVVGSRTFIGSNAVIKETLQIGEDCVVSAGARVFTDLASGTWRRDRLDGSTKHV
jgi:sugar O-acyltransferase (sialic acid O-acetyltransferase NeuD family)